MHDSQYLRHKAKKSKANSSLCPNKVITMLDRIHLTQHKTTNRTKKKKKKKNSPAASSHKGHTKTNQHQNLNTTSVVIFFQSSTNKLLRLFSKHEKICLYTLSHLIILGAMDTPPREATLNFLTLGTILKGDLKSRILFFFKGFKY